MEATLQRERAQLALQSRQQEGELRTELCAERDKGQAMLQEAQRENIKLQRKVLRSCCRVLSNSPVFIVTSCENMVP